MEHKRTWTDVYGSAHASFEGRAGGHRWLLAAPPELAAGIPSQLAALDGKGRVDLLVHDGLTPLLAALRELEPRGVLIVAPRALASGPAVTVPERRVEDAGGAGYREGGEFPAWQGALGVAGEPGENGAASAAASLAVPVVVTAPDHVQVTLEAWMDLTPHGR
ncbi:hypothetical protein E5F05_06750 [Deinococcus metallilatus]|uniref:Uncharacterized protein n=1 Tax=Deinococcus metallilatus TaxID=1211322 RepID=A0AAJ5FAI3_9DEIO|nr:hypothetical protein [Deinococcus metallilatus]MBB5294646.1 hypothetical protein [Deinococcus metallilatus]QBY07682.1 hypothetical protein E5F05_06750 [Deinococcus metallilatus]RXJ14098.1 hypothetical protein ERJ73_05585 [Deinococcus metallilatus]TLK30063.1 hypothetical protein FCS05_05900 [Deinococcus metallilatus]GMA15859.1 hypothetical protein GCM10025871_21900 [Deinococcus metallilatus]